MFTMLLHVERASCVANSIARLRNRARLVARALNPITMTPGRRQSNLKITR